MPCPIVTNGDHAADALRTAFPGRAVLPWRDALVEGPVPDLPEDEFRDLRADYLASAFNLAPETVRADFAARDRDFADMLAGGDGVALWFETDLHDQLQLLEILDRLPRPFLDDAGFFLRLIALAEGAKLIAGLPSTPPFDRSSGRFGRAFLDATLALTKRGEATLAGENDLASDPSFDRWVGGTHLVASAIWRWDETQSTLIPPR